MSACQLSNCRGGCWECPLSGGEADTPVALHMPAYPKRTLRVVAVIYIPAAFLRLLHSLQYCGHFIPVGILLAALSAFQS